jgi:hypothetical protein
VLTATRSQYKEEVPHIYKVIATDGLELAEQLDEWQRSAFQLNLRKPDQYPEPILVQCLMRDLGKSHPLHDVITGPPTEQEQRGFTAEVYATRYAEINGDIHERHLEQYERDQMEKSVYAKGIHKLYPTFTPSAKQIQLRSLAFDAMNHELKAIAEQGESDYAMIQAEIDACEVEHNNRTLEEKFQWLRVQPAYEPTLKALEDSAQFANRLKSLSGVQSLRLSRNPYQTMQFRSVKDMEGIAWLCGYLLRRAGGITMKTVAEFRSERMRPGQSPVQAATRVIHLAEIIRGSGFAGFDMNYELRELFTNQSLKGGAFLTNALYDHIESTVLNEMDRLRASGQSWETHPVEFRELWINTAQRRFIDIRGRGTALDQMIQYQAQARVRKLTNPSGLWSYEPKTMSHYLNSEPKLPYPHDALATPVIGKEVDPAGGKQRTGQHYCEIHGHNKTHTTAQCKAAKRGAAAPPANPAVLTTTPAPGADLTHKGGRPGAKYAGQQNPAAGRGPPGNPPREPNAERPVCELCSSVVGRAWRHKAGECYADPKTPVPEWFNPVNADLRKVINAKRKAQGLSALPPPPDHEARVRSGNARAALVRDILEGGNRVRISDAPAHVFVMRSAFTADNSGMSARVRTVQGHVPPVDHYTHAKASLTFTPSNKKFHCKTCHAACYARQSPDTVC